MPQDILLFSPSRPADAEFAANLETTYAFLNRSARPEFAAVRDRLEAWFARYPDQAKRDLAARFCADDKHHQAAHFELYIHELLLRLGCAVEIHPSILGRTTTPDFSVKTPEGQPLYVEAAIITGQSKSDESADARMRQALDVFERIKTPNFVLDVGWDRDPPAPLPARRIAEKVEKWLAALDPDVELARYVDAKEKFSVLPVLKFPEHQIGLEFRALPKKSDRRADSQRAIGIQAPPGGCVGTAFDLRRRIKSKATRYGDLDAPFVLAVHVVSPFGDEGDVTRGLFGDEVYEFAEGRPDSGQFKIRPNGAWSDVSACDGLAGLLAVWDMRPWTRTEARARLFHNPWAAYPLGAALNRLPSTKVIDRDLVHSVGETLQSVLNL